MGLVKGIGVSGDAGMREDILAVILSAGLAWFLLGLAFAPTPRLYQQGMIVLVYLPALVAAALTWRDVFSSAGREWFGPAALVMLFAWVWTTAWWSEAGNLAQDAKRVAYIAFFLIAVAALGLRRPRLFHNTVLWACYGLALSAAIAIFWFYFVESRPWRMRLIGLGRLDHPIQGGYVIGVAAAILMCSMPQARLARVAWLVALLFCTAFIALTQSRGVWVAFGGVILALPFIRPGRVSLVIIVAALAAVTFGYLYFEPVMTARGTSYRTEILLEALKLWSERPMSGFGLQSVPPIEVPALGHVFAHSHNLFAHVALELGLPGLLLWSAVWFVAGWHAWKARMTPLGGMLLVAWIFSTLAMQFSVGVLWDTPRAQWVTTWFPLALWLALLAQKRTQGHPDR